MLKMHHSCFKIKNAGEGHSSLRDPAMWIVLSRHLTLFAAAQFTGQSNVPHPLTRSNAFNIIVHQTEGLD